MKHAVPRRSDNRQVAAGSGKRQRAAGRASVYVTRGRERAARQCSQRRPAGHSAMDPAPAGSAPPTSATPATPATSPPATPPAHSGFGAFCSAISDTITEDEKKTKRKQSSPVDERPVVPAPSDAMLNNLRTAFGLLDRDSDGHVTPAELQFMLRNLGIQVSDDLIADLIKDASRTGNGLIDENEFMQWVTKIQAIQGLDVGASGGDSEEEITRDLLAAFKVFDRDDNGYITRDELRTALEMIGEPVTDAQLNQVLALGDIDHDGRIDYEEFVKMLL
ncbi:calcium-binding protein E63-1 isoform X2 [Pectinophora gossypiella]|uniref:calcium-binding protein E63-1 isoform X2 n=1 Tax=Pectinophora gossypiella TaxID=13191 RepID=UPI00214F4B5A|nr:calcium-binding protein E63-1 isoform X2 [Pectinophora gossypiella]